VIRRAGVLHKLLTAACGQHDWSILRIEASMGLGPMSVAKIAHGNPGDVAGWSRVGWSMVRWLARGGGCAPEVAAQRRETMRAWRERQRVRKAEQLAAEPPEPREEHSQTPRA
jgi:hypothetical protein